MFAGSSSDEELEIRDWLVCWHIRSLYSEQLTVQDSTVFAFTVLSCLYDFKILECVFDS